MTILTILNNFDLFFWQFLTIFSIFWQFFNVFRFLGSFQSFWKFLWPETWHLRHWLHFWQLRTTIWTITLWPLNREWWWQHSQFLRCFLWVRPKERCTAGGGGGYIALHFFTIAVESQWNIIWCNSKMKGKNLDNRVNAC